MVPGLSRHLGLRALDLPAQTEDILRATIFLCAALWCAGPAAGDPDAEFRAALDGGGQAILRRDAKVSRPPRVFGRRVDEVRDDVVRLLKGSGVPIKFIDAAFDDPRRAPPVGQVLAQSDLESLPYSDYRDRFLTERRIVDGAQFLASQKTTLSAVSARYGVDKLLLTAIIGIETTYGRGRGASPIFSALASLAASTPKKRDYAEKELAALLKLCWFDHYDVYSIYGSYAGAFGYAQFIPSTWNRFKIDFDGDGKARFDQWPDALATQANYLQACGYSNQSPDFSPGSQNWKAVFAYNHSDNYVRVIFDLRQAIARRAEIELADQPPISLAEMRRRAAQRLKNVHNFSDLKQALSDGLKHAGKRGPLLMQ